MIHIICHAAMSHPNVDIYMRVKRFQTDLVSRFVAFRMSLLCDTSNKHDVSAVKLNDKSHRPNRQSQIERAPRIFDDMHPPIP